MQNRKKDILVKLGRKFRRLVSRVQKRRARITDLKKRREPKKVIGTTNQKIVQGKQTREVR